MAERAPPETRAEAGRREATRDPIFLFQRRRWLVVGCPDGYAFDADGDCVRCDEDGEPLPDGEVLPRQKLAEHRSGEWDVPCAIEEWDTERVYLSREAAEAYGQARAYNYRDGWRVYCVCAEGALAGLLKQHGEAAWVADRASRAEAAHPEVSRG